VSKPIASLLFEDFSDILTTYLEEGSLAIAVLDSDRRILCCNTRFAKAAGLNQSEGDPTLDELVQASVGEALDMPGDGQGWNINIVFDKTEGQARQWLCSVFRSDDRYVMFCHPSETADARIVERISRLNDELTNLNRELRKKEQALERANERIQRIARTDPLTELPNRRHFNERLSETLSAVHRHSFPLSVTMADLDHFKDVNDDFGHDAGDRVLKVFANLLQRSCRQEDLPARWGGEEFIVMMPYTSPDDARTFAERVRENLRNADCKGVDRSVSASFGITGHTSEDTQDSLLNRADRALYKAKEKGRDRVEVI